MTSSKCGHRWTERHFRQTSLSKCIQKAVWFFNLSMLQRTRTSKQSWSTILIKHFSIRLKFSASTPFWCICSPSGWPWGLCAPHQSGDILGSCIHHPYWSIRDYGRNIFARKKPHLSTYAFPLHLQCTITFFSYSISLLVDYLTFASFSCGSPCIYFSQLFDVWRSSSFQQCSLWRDV